MKKEIKRILVTNNTFANLGGSETYAYTLMHELNRRGYDVKGYSPTLGYVANILNQEGINVSTNPFLFGKFDAIFASHTSTIPMVRKYINTPIIQTSHGIYPSLEQPHPDVDKHVAISYEVFNHLYGKGYDSTVIHNGIDCERFKPINKLNSKLETILSLTQNDELNSMLHRICKRKGIKLITLNKFINPVWNVEDVINQADLVISLGRGAYEAMACGRPVFVLDQRPYGNLPILGDGIVNDFSLRKIMYNNCSGRYSNVIYDEKMIEEELDKYDPTMGATLREFALEELNIKIQVDKYLNLI